MLKIIKLIFFNLKIFLIIVLVLGIFVEIYARIFSPRIYSLHEDYGWKLKANLDVEIKQKNLNREIYNVKFKTNSESLRLYGDLDSDIEILVIGDSFVSEAMSSNDKMWYSILADQISQYSNKKVKVYSGGAGGWSSYQQYLLIKELKKKYNPSLFILQFCDNDYMANLYEFEKLSIQKQQFYNRPFANFIGENIEPIKRNDNFTKIFRFFNNNSRVFGKLNSMYERYQYNQYNSYIQKLDNGLEAKLSNDAIIITTKILKKIRNVYNDVPALLVNCYDNNQNKYFYKKWIEIGKKTNFNIILKPSVFVKKKISEKNKKLLNIDGKHLSELGNIEYGKIFFNELLDRNILNKIIIPD